MNDRDKTPEPLAPCGLHDPDPSVDEAAIRQRDIAFLGLATTSNPQFWRAGWDRHSVIDLLDAARAHPPAPLPLDVDDPRSRCAICRRVIAVEFVAPADLWLAAAREFQHEHLCIACFDERVPADWPVFWETVTTLWPVSRGRATASAAEPTEDGGVG